METIHIIILLIIGLIIVILMVPDDNQEILANDYNYFEKFSQKKIISKLINANRLDKPVKKKNKILFITYDNRYKEEYVQIHNYNIKKYAEQYEYEDKFYNRCNDNVYWCKIFMVLDLVYI